MRNLLKKGAIFAVILALFAGCSNPQLPVGQERDISYKTIGNGQVVATIVQEATGPILNIAVTPNAGWKLSKLLYNGTDITSTGTNLFTVPVTVTEIRIEATFVPDVAGRYSISVQQDPARGTINASAVSETAGAVVTLNLAAQPGYVYKENTLTVNGTAVTARSPAGLAFTFVMPAANVTVTAVFDKVLVPEYAIVANTISNGTGVASKYNAAAGEEITVTLAANAGYTPSANPVVVAYRAGGASVPVTGSGNVYKFTMVAADVSLAVSFDLIPVQPKFTVKYTAPVGSDSWGNGYNARFEVTNTGTAAASDWTVTMNLAASDISVWVGTAVTKNNGVVTLKATAGSDVATIAPGATVKVGFTVLGTMNQPSEVKMLSTGPSVVVKFDSQGGTAAADKSVTQGDAIGSLPVSTRSGYILSGWYTAPLGAGTAVSSSTLAAGAMTVYANWVVSQVVPYSSSGSFADIPAFNWPAVSGTTVQRNRTTSAVTAQKSVNGEFITPASSWGNMLVVNNLWGIPSNGTGTATVFSETVNSTDTYGWSWDFNSPKKNVVAYQEIGWGWSPNRANTLVKAQADFGYFNKATPLYKLNDSLKYYVDFDIRRTDRSGAWNTAFDIWLTKKAKPYGGTGTEEEGVDQNGKNGPNQLYEIMIWFDRVEQGPWGDNGQAVTINGEAWTVYDNNGSAGWRVISYLKNGGAKDTVRNYDISAFMTDAANRYSGARDGYPGLTMDHMVSAIEFGSESCGGTGMFEIANYRLVIK